MFVDIPHLRVGDWGTVLTFQVNDSWNQPSDLSPAVGSNALQIKIVRPDGTEFIRAMGFVTDGKDGKLSYTLQQGDLSIEGQYQANCIVTFPSGEWTTTIAEFNVDPVL